MVPIKNTACVVESSGDSLYIVRDKRLTKHSIVYIQYTVCRRSIIIYDVMFYIYICVCVSDIFPFHFNITTNNIYWQECEKRISF